MDNSKGTEKLLTELLTQVYHHVKDKQERKTWQFVCRGWYQVANDVTRIQVRVFDYTKRSLENLFKDSEKYPTFGTKILSIMDRSNENKASCHITSERFYKMLCAFPFIKKVYFNLQSMEMLRDYLVSSGSQQTSLMNLEEVHSLEPSHKSDMVSYVFCLQVCYLLRRSITSLNIRVKPGGPVEVALNEGYGGVPAYIIKFPKLDTIKDRGSLY